MISNQKTYQSRNIVKHYATLKDLQRPEQTIFDQLAPNLRGMRMLDIGVGGGRTTSYFAPFVREYVGIDYSASMIEACIAKFAPVHKHASFKVCDVRTMNDFAEHSFDLVLFSYNGIDSLSHADRLLALKEIKRVVKYGGTFVFSTHNIGSIGSLRLVRAKTSARGVYDRFVRNPLLLLFNENFSQLQNRNYSILRDGTHWFRLKNYYIKPSEQMRQLAEVGFTNIRSYHLNGSEIRNIIESEAGVVDHWIYYSCNG
jgi:ubiquinone/menaquinone biosynthesis C-methylase UbiE